ncbi:ABC transporter ATP-binding protein [Spirulina major CS-329]|uniref:ABC transporter ATP-binding protein n=1 Tax=Spirulina TaxID=1154 RepID=UPI00232BE1A0|nr:MULTISPECIES: ABC transporter ATP-binding protein [Spirulina]MDB9493919.1 ABC transporter ATP-binding protein [Spirulina subsalsa CS-330]MDB9501669.1 ABC transporter ATP-binding protein [Spirulina major CS-329]
MSDPSITLAVEKLAKHFANTRQAAVSEVSFHLRQGDILTLLGPSGCGKTTLLRLIAGFEEPDYGTVMIDGRYVVGDGREIPPEKRGVGMVFQDYALFPHLTVGENIAFGLQGSGKLTKATQQRIGEVLQLVGLEGLGQRYPYQLSGGQQQRVALARALAPRPALVLLDEPLSNLDVQVRSHLRQELRHILKAAGTSAIFVTHDQEEALAISDAVGVMQQGQLEQIDRPETVYYRPRSRFVAEFVTQANFLPAQRRADGWETEVGRFEIATELEGDRAELMIRQEQIRIAHDPNGIGVVGDRQFLGREQSYRVELPSGQRLNVRTMARIPFTVGDRVSLTIDPFALQLFPALSRTVELSEDRHR